MKAREQFFTGVPTCRLTLWDKIKIWRHTQDPNMIDKLKSRKLWVTVITAAITALSGQLGIDPALTDKLVTITAAYVLGQSFVDGSGRARV